MDDACCTYPIYPVDVMAQPQPCLSHLCCLHAVGRVTYKSGVTNSGLQHSGFSSAGSEDRQMHNLVGLHHSQKIFCTSQLTVYRSAMHLTPTNNIRLYSIFKITSCYFNFSYTFSYLKVFIHFFTFNPTQTRFLQQYILYTEAPILLHSVFY